MRKTWKFGLFCCALLLARTSAGDGPSAPPRFSAQGGEVHDAQTGLRWQRSVGDAMNLSAAKDYCSKLSLNGHGWRLPSLGELKGIVAHGRSPAIAESAFPSTPSESFWTSTKSKDHLFPSVVDFGSGNEGVSPEGISNRVRCVHDAAPVTTSPPQCAGGLIWNGTTCVAAPVCPIGYAWNGTACAPPPACPAGTSWNGSVCVQIPTCPPDQKWNGSKCAAVEQLISNGRFAVTQAHVRDTRTSLTWQRAAQGAMPYASAEKYCASLAVDGGGFRLPTKSELDSILVKDKNPAIDLAAFPGTEASTFWTSTRNDSTTDFLIVVDFFNAMSHASPPAIGNRVRCVK